MAPHSLLKQLHDGTERWSIVVRVWRRWNVYQKKHPADLFCITMILVDQEGNKIQASVIPKNLHERFRGAITEGQTYFIANFVVSQNTSQYRATNHQFKINFTTQTFLKQQAVELPLDAYCFMPISEIMKSQQRNFPEHLIDVVAFVRSVGMLEEFRRDNETKNKLRMILTDAENNDLECVLFDECSTNAYLSQLENMETPVVVVLNLVRIAFSDDGRPQVCSSFSATRVFFNPAIREVKDLIESAKDNDSFQTPTISQLMANQSSQHSNSSILSNNNKILISQIPDQKIGQPFVVNCSLQKLETRHGWCYDGCGKCSSKLRDEDDASFCPGCKKKPESIQSKIKVHYTVADKSGVASVIFWDKLGVELLGKSAAELKTILKEDDREYDFPDECDLVVGKTMMLKLKLNEWNAKHTGSGISVVQYTVCENLADEFNDVVNQDQPLAHSTAQEVSQVNSQVTLGEESDVVAMNTPISVAAIGGPTESDAISLSQNGNNVVATTTKGRRRCYLKRHGVVAESSSQSNGKQSIPTEEPVLKVVKIEK